MSTVMSNLIDTIGQFFSGIGDIITDDFMPLLAKPPKNKEEKQQRKLT